MTPEKCARRRLRRAGLLLAALGAAVLAACGGESPEEVVRETTANLGRIRSGDLSMRVLAAPRGKSLERGTGFLLDGPFSLSDRRGELPTTDVEYTRVAGSERSTLAVVSTGRRAFLRMDGQTYEMPSDRERALRGASGPAGPSGQLERLRIASWVREPEIVPGPSLDGVETDRLRSGVDVVSATNALLEASGQSAPGRPAITGAEAERLTRAVRSARLELVTGAEDRLLRRLRLDLELEAGAPPALLRTLGPLGGATFELELTVDRVNEPVRVRAPKDALPASALGG